jgi:hypothetical protein
MPILGILASAITGNLVTNSYESIATVTVGGATGYAEFTSIPSTFTHLQVRLITDTSAGDVSIGARFNSDTGSNYAYQTLYGDGSNVYVNYNGVSQTSYLSFARGGNNSGAFGAAVVDILDYKNTNKYKTVRSLTGRDTNGGASGGIVWFSSGVWQSTSAITSIRLTPESGNLNTYSSFALYGIKGA